MRYILQSKLFRLIIITLLLSEFVVLAAAHATPLARVNVTQAMGTYMAANGFARPLNNAFVEFSVPFEPGKVFEHQDGSLNLKVVNSAGAHPQFCEAVTINSYPNPTQGVRWARFMVGFGPSFTIHPGQILKLDIVPGRCTGGPKLVQQLNENLFRLKGRDLEVVVSPTHIQYIGARGQDYVRPRSAIPFISLRDDRGETMNPLPHTCSITPQVNTQAKGEVRTECTYQSSHFELDIVSLFSVTNTGRLDFTVQARNSANERGDFLDVGIHELGVQLGLDSRYNSIEVSASTGNQRRALGQGERHVLDVYHTNTRRHSDGAYSRPKTFYLGSEQRKYSSEGVSILERTEDETRFPVRPYMQILRSGDTLPVTAGLKDMTYTDTGSLQVQRLGNRTVLKIQGFGERRFLRNDSPHPNVILPYGDWKSFEGSFHFPRSQDRDPHDHIIRLQAPLFGLTTPERLNMGLGPFGEVASHAQLNLALYYLGQRSESSRSIESNVRGEERKKIYNEYYDGRAGGGRPNTKHPVIKIGQAARALEAGFYPIPFFLNAQDRARYYNEELMRHPADGTDHWDYEPANREHYGVYDNALDSQHVFVNSAIAPLLPALYWEGFARTGEELQQRFPLGERYRLHERGWSRIQQAIMEYLVSHFEYTGEFDHGLYAHVLTWFERHAYREAILEGDPAYNENYVGWDPRPGPQEAAVFINSYSYVNDDGDPNTCEIVSWQLFLLMHAYRWGLELFIPPQTPLWNKAQQRFLQLAKWASAHGFTEEWNTLYRKMTYPEILDLNEDEHVSHTGIRSFLKAFQDTGEPEFIEVMQRRTDLFFARNSEHVLIRSGEFAEFAHAIEEMHRQR